MLTHAAVLLALIAATPSPGAAAPCERDERTTELLAALSDQDPDIRALSADLLSDRTGGQRVEAVDALQSVLRDAGEPWRVRAAAARSLGRLTASSEEAAFASMLEVAADADQDWRVRAAAVQALWSVEDGRALERLLEERGQPLTIATSSGTVALGARNVEELLASVDALLDGDARIRRLATVALVLAGQSLEPTRALSSHLATPCTAPSQGEPGDALRAALGLALRVHSADAL